MELQGLLLLVMAVAVFYPVPVSADVCPYNKCTCSGDSIACFGSTYLNLPPPNKTSGIKYKFFTAMSDTLHTIPDGSLVGNLSFMKFKFTPITYIGPHAFDDSAATLNFFEIWSAPFSKIPDAFGSLQTLTTLHMSEMVITDWNDEVFRHLGRTISEMILAGTGLLSWPEWMTSFTNLTTLEFSTQSMPTIPDNAFDKLTDKLTKLTLNEVNLSQLPASLANLRRLEQLFLDQNKLSYLSNLPKSTTLKSLSLSGNGIADEVSLLKELAPLSNSLTFLGLNNNKLKTIPNLFNMTSLNILDLEANDMSNPNTGHLPSSITMLYLRFNKLTGIPVYVSAMVNLSTFLIANNAISDLHYTQIPKALTGLDLSQNLITKLNDDSLPRNSALKQLSFDSNPIVNISPLAFADLTVLETLTLSNTSLTRVPLALLKVNGLLELHMEDNASLLCTCQEKALVPWFEAHPNMRVYGTCGNDTIDHFFRVVAKSCPQSILL